METVGQPSPPAACNLLGVPGLGSLDPDDDEGEVVIGIRPKSSPLPRRRTSVTDDDSDFEPPLSGSRRVSFADAKGLSLVQVKEFDTWDVPKLPGYESSEGEVSDVEEYFLSLLSFSLPLPTEELFANVREHKAELETLELVTGTTILKGVIRVLNVSFDKAVYIRTSLDSWSTHFDLLAEYIPGSSDGVTDCFSFRLTLVPPFGEQGARVDFCLRYETSVGTFWANNNNRNYVFSCQQRKIEDKKKAPKERMNKKSCLKPIGQNFSAVENNSAKEDPTQENNSADASNHVEGVQTIPTSNNQSGTSGEREQKLLMENRHNSSRRSRRKAARMARVKHYFAQRGAAGNDSERDESPPETKQAAAEKGPEEKHAALDSESARKQAESSRPASDALERCSGPLQEDTSPSHDGMSNGESVKPESATVVDSAVLPGGAAKNEDKLLSSDNEPPPAEQPNTKETVTEAEESRPNQDTGGASANSTAPVSSESLVSPTECFTFGTVVAPLYQQVFGRAGSDGQHVADWGNPAWAATINGDANPHTERGQNSCTDPTDVTSESCKAEGGVGTHQESNLEFIDAALNDAIHEGETSLNQMVNGVQDGVETSAEIVEQEQECTSHAPQPAPSEMIGLPESTHLQGEELEEEEIPDLQSQTTAEQRQHQLANLTAAQTATDKDETQKAKISLHSSVVSPQPSQSASELKTEETNQQNNSKGESNCINEDLTEAHHICSIAVTSKTSLKDNGFIDVRHDSNSHHTDAPDTEETVIPFVSCSEVVEETDLTTLEKSLETQRETNNLEKEKEETCSSIGDKINPSVGMKVQEEVAEKMTKAITNTDEIHGDIVSVGCEDKDTIKEETAGSKQDEDLMDDTRVQNWEAMVEEEENNIIIDEESERLNIKTEDFKSMEEVTTEQENKKTEKGGVKEALRSEDEEQVEREETVGAAESQDVEIELDYVPITKSVRTAEEEELAEVIDVEATEEAEDREKSCTEHYNNGFLEEPNFQREEERDWKEEMEISLKNKDAAAVQGEDQIKPEEENDEQGSPYHKEETVVVDAEGETVGADKALEDGEVEVEREGEESDITINTVEGEQEVIGERAIEKESEGVTNEQIQMDSFPQEEEEVCQTNSNLIHNQPKAESDSTAAEGDACFLTDEPENQDSASTESDSDDEVELYMHCLRAVSAGAQAQKDRNADAGFAAGKRPSISRSRRLSTPMPSISESVDEEQQLGCLVENQEDADAAAAPPASSGQEGVKNVPWWKDTFSCSNISKTLLYATLLAVFLVVAYHYDFLACFALYLMSVVWLYCQGEGQPAKNNNRIE